MKADKTRLVRIEPQGREFKQSTHKTEDTKSPAGPRPASGHYLHNVSPAEAFYYDINVAKNPKQHILSDVTCPGHTHYTNFNTYTSRETITRQRLQKSLDGLLNFYNILRNPAAGYSASEAGPGFYLSNLKFKHNGAPAVLVVGAAGARERQGNRACVDVELGYERATA